MFLFFFLIPSWQTFARIFIHTSYGGGADVCPTVLILRYASCTYYCFDGNVCGAIFAWPNWGAPGRDSTRSQWPAYITWAAVYTRPLAISWSLFRSTRTNGFAIKDRNESQGIQPSSSDAKRTHNQRHLHRLQPPPPRAKNAF